MQPSDKIKSILSGYKKLIIRDRTTEELAKERAAICSECPHIKKGFVDAILKSWNVEKVSASYCGICKCVLAAKTRTKFERCPKNKW